MISWNDTEKCEYPYCDIDEAVPVWIVSEGVVVEAWYRNPSMDNGWFESDIGAVINSNLWIETLSVTSKPAFTTERCEDNKLNEVKG